MSKTDLTPARLREVLTYDPALGSFTWNRLEFGGNKFGGKPAGTVTSSGYLQIRIDRQGYRAARLAWLYMTGHWPENIVDHKNRNRLDNKFTNLRDVTPAGSTQNRGLDRGGVRLAGADRRKGRWAATISADGAHHYLGLYGTQEEAHAVYVAAKKRLHPFFIA